VSFWLDIIGWTCGGAFAVYVLRTAEPSKRWLAAVFLGLPLIAIHLPPVRHPSVVVIADVAWIAVLFACFRANRVFGTWAAIVCAVCTTSLRLEVSMARSTAAAHSDAAGAPEH
jgi:hypothetical protein